MKFDKIFSVFNKYTELSVAEQEYFRNNVEFVSYKKGQIMHDFDQDCKFIWFINKGFGRYYCKNSDGTQTTANFFGESDFVTDYESFFNKSKTFGYIEALTDVEALVISENLLFWFLFNVKNAYKLKEEISNYYYSICSRRVESLLEKDPAIIFSELLNKFPDIEQVVTQKVIASYLNITPIHLSRLKSRIYSKVSN